MNNKAKNGLTPLHLCAQEDRVDVAKLLVSIGTIHLKTANKNTNFGKKYISTNEKKVPTNEFTLRSMEKVYISINKKRF